MTSPVLFLGLGGTGKQTLMHLRRLYLDEYGSGALPENLVRRYGPGRLPHTGFLCLDSDERLEDIDGKKFDEMLLAAQLSGAEFLRVEIQTDRVNELYDHPERHAEYAPWYDFGLDKKGIPRNGCGQTRPWGRLAFFQHYQLIRTTIASTIRQLINVETAAAAREIDVNNLRADRVEVFVVFSVAGGTGSGMFLDVAFLLRDLERELGCQIPIQAIVLLPTVFGVEPSSKLFANGYAALLELEYYNLKRPGADQGAGDGWFPIYWPGDYVAGAAPKTLRGPVFEAVWLIGDRSRGVDGRGDGAIIRPDQKHELTAMAAEWLFIRNSPSHAVLGAIIDADASNYVVNEMAEIDRVDVFEEGDDRATGTIDMTCRYASFGLSKIFSPTNLVETMAGHRLIQDVIDQWLATPGENIKIDENIDHDVRPKLLLRLPSEDHRDLRDENAMFDWIDRAGSGESVLGEALAKFNAEFDSGIADSAGTDLARVLREKMAEHRRRFISAAGDNADDHGHFASLIHANAAVAQTKIREGLDIVIGEALRDPGRRFPFANEALRRLRKEFGEVVDRASGRATDAARESAAATKDADEVLAHAREERSARVRRTIAKVAISDQADAIRFEIERQIFQAVADLARDAARRIGDSDDTEAAKDRSGGSGRSVLQQLGVLAANLKEMRDRIEERIKGLASRNRSLLNFQVVSSDPNDFYVDADGHPIAPSFVRAVADRLYGDPAIFGGGLGSPWALRTRLSGAAAEQVLDRLVDQGRVEMSHVAHRGDDVLTLFDRQFTGRAGERDYADAMRPYVKGGTAWLAITRSERGRWRAARHFRVARPPHRSAAATRLENVFRSEFGALDASFVDGTDDTVYFAQEVAGFPLSVLPGIADYRDRAYVPLITRMGGVNDPVGGGGAGLHIELHSEKYVDLVEPSIETASRRAAAVELFIEALVKRRIKPNRDRYGMVFYTMLERVGFSDVITDLGRYDRAVRVLTDPGATSRVQLSRQVQDLEPGWPDGEATSQLKVRLLALLDYYALDVSRPIKGVECQRAALRVIQRLQVRWKSDTAAVQAARRDLGWAVDTLPGNQQFPASGHLAAPDLPDPQA